MKQDGVRARTVSIIRDRNGDSKRYAFVEFDDVFEAEAWLKISKVRAQQEKISFN